MRNMFKTIRQGGDVLRFHTVALGRGQTVAAHSWGVATLVLELWPDASRELLIAALYHDVPEAVLGDLPAPAKWEHAELAKAYAKAEAGIALDLGVDFSLTDEDHKRLRIADMLELLWFCLEQRRLGNRNVEEIWDRGLKYLATEFLWEDRVGLMVLDLKGEWNDVIS